MSAAYSLSRMGVCDLHKSIPRVNRTPQNRLRIRIIKMMKTPIKNPAFLLPLLRQLVFITSTGSLI